jgi:1,4-alpha-glucan branching enzyme
MAKQIKKKVEFSLDAPEATTVLLAGDFTGWQQKPLAFTRQKTGIWKLSVVLPSGAYQYRFLVDGQWQNDSSCNARCLNEFGSENCVCKVG